MILALSSLTKALGTPEPLADLYPALIEQVLRSYQDEQPLIRSVACFAMPMMLDYDLASYGVKDLTPRVIRGTLEQLQDDCGETRFVAMRGLATLLAFSPIDMTVYIDKIINALEICNKVLASNTEVL